MARPGPSFDSIMLRAAVSGWFAPDALLGDVPAEQQEDFAGELSLVCDEDPIRPGKWFLQAAKRREMLARLDIVANVRAAIDGAPDAAGDDFASALRGVLLGEEPSVDMPAAKSPTSPALVRAEEERHSALQFAGAAPVVDEQRRIRQFDRTRATIALQHYAAERDFVLPGPLHGRLVEVAKLRAFARGDEGVKPMLVTGIGGVGKSALIAGVVREWLDAGEIAIVLDFDRPELSEGNPLRIVHEFVRRLEFACLGLAEADSLLPRLKEIRARMRLMETESLGTTADRQLSFMISIIYPMLAEVPLQMPILLVFDSFEVVGTLGDVVAERIVGLANDLQVLADLPKLRTVVSGRESPLPEEDTVSSNGVPIKGNLSSFGPPERRIRVEGFDDIEGGAFLALRDGNRRFPDQATRERLSHLLRGHPLGLIVLERYARDRSAHEIDELVADLSTDTSFAAEFAHAFVYTRILERIRDDSVRALAHPGLVLRRISGDLIRLVLAEPCALGKLDAKQAQKLLDRLASECWLVEPFDGAFRHRPDLRRLMLPGLFAGPRDGDLADIVARKNKLREATLAVCASAARFYSEGPPADDPAFAWWSGLSETRRAVEAQYYRALAGEDTPEQISTTIAAELYSSTGGDFETLPRAWRALVLATTGRYNLLTDFDRQTLKGATRDNAEKASIEFNLRSGQVSTAARQASEEVARRQGHTPDLELLEHQIGAAFEEARFEDAAEPAQALLEASADSEVRRRVLREVETGRLWSTRIWEGALSLVAVGAQVRQVPWFTSTQSRYVILNSAVTLIGTLLVPENEHRFRPLGPDEIDGWKGHLPSIDGLRHAMLLLRADEERPGLRNLQIDIAAMALGREATGGATSSELQSIAKRIHSGPNSLDSLERRYASGRPLRFGDCLDLYGLSRGAGIAPGLMPELHAPAARLLRDLNRGVASRIAYDIAVRALGWPTDLWVAQEGRAPPPVGIVPRPFDPRLAITVIETADRFGLLRHALTKLAEQSPRANGLLRIHDAVVARFFAPRTVI